MPMHHTSCLSCPSSCPSNRVRVLPVVFRKHVLQKFYMLPLFYCCCIMPRHTMRKFAELHDYSIHLLRLSQRAQVFAKCPCTIAANIYCTFSHTSYLWRFSRTLLHILFVSCYQVKFPPSRST